MGSVATYQKWLYARGGKRPPKKVARPAHDDTILTKDVRWGEFRVGDLFEVKTSRSLDKGNLTLIDKGYQFIGRTYDNNGIQGYIAARDFEPNSANVFSVSQIGSVHAQFRESLWYASQNIFILTPNVDGLVQCKLYLIAALNKSLKKFDGGYTVYPTLETLHTMLIQLPITPSGKPDFDYMEAYIAQLEAERVVQLEAYLLATGLADYDLSPEEERVLAAEVTWGEFRVGDLFWQVKLRFRGEYPFADIKKGNISREKSKEFSLPLVNAKSGDNGIMYWAREKDFENIENSIAIIADGAVSTGDVHPQPQKTGVLYNAYLIKPYANLQRECLCYCAAVLQKSIKLKYGYENKATWGKVENEVIQLPITPSGKPDFEYMEAYIHVQQKQVIAAVVRGLDLEVCATREIVGGCKT